MNHLYLVEDDSDLVILRANCFNSVLELIRDIQLVRVKHQDDPVKSSLEWHKSI